MIGDGVCKRIVIEEDGTGSQHLAQTLVVALGNGILDGDIIVAYLLVQGFVGMQGNAEASYQANDDG